MIFTALVLAAAAPADAVPKARQTYASCLHQFTDEAVDKKMAKDEFPAALKANAPTRKPNSAPR